MTRTRRCGQVIRPKAKVASARSRTLRSRPSGPPISEGQRAVLALPAGDAPRQAGAVELAARFVERHQHGTRRHRLEQPLALLAQAPLDRLAAARRDLDQADRPGRAAAVVLEEIPGRAGAVAADRRDDHLHRAARRLRSHGLGSAAGTGLGSAAGLDAHVRQRRAPQPLEIVETPGLVLEQMDDHVAGVDQHPIGLAASLGAEALAGRPP